MKNSVRRTFETFETNKEKEYLSRNTSRADNYAKFLDLEVKEDTVFMLNYTEQYNHDCIENLAENITGKKIYCSSNLKGCVQNKRNIEFVRENSKKYFKLLATAKYVIVGSQLSMYFVPRKEQCVITLLDNCEVKNFDDKLLWNKIILKSDIVFAKNDNVSEILEKQGLNRSLLLGIEKKYSDILDMINTNQIVKANTVMNGKENIILTGHLTHPEKWMGLITGYLNHIDYDNYNTILVISNKEKKECEKFYSLLDQRVNIVAEEGWSLVREEQRKLYDYINTDLTYFENPDEIFDYISRSIFERELARIIGNYKVDKFILAGDQKCNINKWVNIARASSAKSREMVYDPNYYIGIITNIEKNKTLDKTVTKIYSEFDKIYFSGTSARDEYLEKVKEYDIDFAEEKIGYLKLYEQNNLKIKTEEVIVDGTKNIIYNRYKLNDNVLNILEVPKENAIGLLIDSDKECEKFPEISEKIKETDRQVIIFDVKMNGLKFSVLGDANSNVTYYVGAIYYYVLKDYIDTFVVDTENKERISELKASNKNIIFDLEQKSL